MQDEKTFARLRIFNAVMGLFHLLQGILMVVLSNDFSVTLTTSFLKWSADAGMPITNIDEAITIRVGPAVAVFMFLSALAHFLLASPGIYEWYVKNLKKRINYLRWYEYALSSSWMVAIIAVLSGMFDLPSLILLMAVNASMILFGLMMELHNQTTKKTDWTSFIWGSVIGLVPWIVIGWYFFTAINSAGETVPTFVYWILVSLFLFFNIFPVNMFLQYKKAGPWKNYLYGERVYIILSLVAKSLLAWQVFFGTLRPN